MKRWGRLLCIVIAYGIALLHTAVPHHHTQIGNREVVLSHKGCVLPDGFGSGLLQRVFAADLGIGHLETFKKGSDSEIEFTPRVTAAASAVSQPELAIARVIAFPEFLDGYIHRLTRERLLSSNTSFRAPPTLVPAFRC